MASVSLAIFLRFNMTKLKTLSAIALLSALLTACDKPVETTSNVVNTAPAAQTETKPETAPSNQEKTEVNAEEKTAEVVDTGAEDYKKFREWQKTQEQGIENAITAEVEKLGDKAKDEKLLRDAMNRALLAQSDAIKQSADTLQITDEKVKQLKEKSLEALALGIQLMAEGEKVAQQPTEASHKIFSELQAKLDQVAKEGKALEAELIKKYEAAPEQKAVIESTTENK